MVRFARAHGSKGSNERVPEEATSWLEMRQQLEAVSSTTDNQNGSSSPTKKPFVFKKTSDDVPVKWAEFEPHSQIPEVKTKLVNEDSPVVLLESAPKKKKKCKKHKCHSEEDALHKVSAKSHKIKKDKPTAIDRLCKNVKKKCAIDIVPSLSKKEQSKLLKKQQKADKLKLESAGGDGDTQEGDTQKSISKRSLKRKQQLQKKGLLDKKGELTSKNISEEVVASPNKPVGPISKRQKRNLKHQLKKIAEASATQTGTLNGTGENPSGETSKLVETKASKRKKERKGTESLDGKRHKRRKPDQGVSVMNFNGRDVEVVQYDGFPVRKQDADRLTELRSQMVANLIPEEEIEHTMKMERRKAEKALARERKKVCFHCRKSGHNLSECPELGEEAHHEAPSSGICYKCGSMEHTHFECRVNRGQEFRFAKCFICNEQGHISNQCPDNPRGLYPKGGGCKVCGDVTHLKKNCPDLISMKEDSGITLGTGQSAGIESLDEDMQDDHSNKPAQIAPKAKVVKF